MASTQKGRKERTAGHLSGTTTRRRRIIRSGKSQSDAPAALAAGWPGTEAAAGPQDGKYRACRLMLRTWDGKPIFAAPLMLSDETRDGLVRTLGGIALQIGIATAWRVARAAGSIRLLDKLVPLAEQPAAGIPGLPEGALRDALLCSLLDRLETKSTAFLQALRHHIPVSEPPTKRNAARRAKGGAR